MMYDIFIDESGTLSDPNDKYVVVVAVASNNPRSLVKIIPKARKRIPPKKKLKRERLVSEFKFRNVGDKTKERILEQISKAQVKLFVLICDKENRAVADNPENYAILVGSLLRLCSLKLEKIGRIIVDRHFNQSDKQTEFNETIWKLMKNEIPIYHTDSLTDSRVNLADFVAGATLKELRSSDAHFKEIIRAKIVKEARTTWRKLYRAMRSSTRSLRA